MSEDDRKRGDVRRREIKTKREPQKKEGTLSGQPGQGSSKSRRPQQGKPRGGSSQRTSQGQQRSGKDGNRQKQQKAKQPAEPKEERKTAAPAPQQSPRPDSQERKKRSGRSRRGSRKQSKQEGQQFRGEETAADVARDIIRIEKDIQFDLDSIRNQKLDL